MATFIVNTNLDIVDAEDGLLSLREAIAQANSQSNLPESTPDRITFQLEDGAVIRLTQGELTITEALEIFGGGDLVISGDANGDDITHSGTSITNVFANNGFSGDFLDDNSRIFNITGAGTDVTLTGMTLTGVSQPSAPQTVARFAVMPMYSWIR